MHFLRNNISLLTSPNVFQSSSKEAKMTKPVVVDMPCVSTPVASKKNLFEAGEAWSQTSLKGTPSKVRNQMVTYSKMKGKLSKCKHNKIIKVFHTTLMIHFKSVWEFCVNENFISHF